MLTAVSSSSYSSSLSSISAAAQLRIEGLQNQVEQLKAMAPSVQASALRRDNEMLRGEVVGLKKRLEEVSGRLKEMEEDRGEGEEG